MESEFLFCHIWILYAIKYSSNSGTDIYLEIKVLYSKEKVWNSFRSGRGIFSVLEKKQAMKKVFGNGSVIRSSACSQKGLYIIHAQSLSEIGLFLAFQNNYFTAIELQHFFWAIGVVLIGQKHFFYRNCYYIMMAYNIHIWQNRNSDSILYKPCNNFKNKKERIL